MASESSVRGLREIDWDRYDFLDLGCSRGGSIKLCRRRFRARHGLGVDLDPRKVADTRRAGFDAVEADATRLDGIDRVRFVSMVDFLEHLPDLDAVAATLASAAAIATDFLYVQHPSFEGEGAVEHLGVRQYWWHWSGHKAHPKVADYRVMLEELGLHRYSIRFRGAIHDSSEPTLVPVDAPPNQQAFDPAVHSPKPQVAFGSPLWRTQEILVALRPFEASEWSALVKGRLGWRLRARIQQKDGTP